MKKQTQQGFTLIELMIVIAIVGILAALALPAYQQYTVRAKVGEGLAYASEAKTSISEHYATKGSYPTGNATAGVPKTVDTDIVDSVIIGNTGSLITISLKTSLAKDIIGANKFLLSAVANATTRRVEWTCKAGATTPVPSKYLPSSCR